MRSLLKLVVVLGLSGSATLAQSDPGSAGDPGITWDTLPELMDLAAANGFCGSILAVHDDEVVLDKGYGHADPEGEHPVTPDTLFAIGSTPIDFTHGAVLKLAEMGEVSLDDPIGTYLDPVLARAGERGGFPDGVPADKRGITLEMLRTGRSGLIDFPGLPGVDENLDLSWIDRDEFLRRIMASELRFAPGTREEHSHAAWGLLAAIAEIASGQDYEAFLREHFFEPAGMTRTGHYPLAKRFPSAEVAVGLGGNVWGEVNSPPHWGRTSWLVLGSGGMVSTPRDLQRWREFLRSGEVLGAESLRRYSVEGPSVFDGGNDRGFINTIGYRGDSIVIVCSNSQVEEGDLTAQIAMAAAEVGAGSPEPPEDAAGAGGGVITDRGRRPGVDFELVTDAFVLQPLRPDHVELDYKACMDNRAHLRAALGWGGWPSDDMTLEQDRGDLARHYGQFERDEAYAFTVLSPARDECTGCVYVNRSPEDPQAVALAYWVIEREVAHDLDAKLLGEVLRLLPTWGFTRAVVQIPVGYARGIEVAEAAGLTPGSGREGSGRVRYVWEAR